MRRTGNMNGNTSKDVHTLTKSAPAKD